MVHPTLLSYDAHHQLFVDDHLAYDGMHRRFLHLEHLGECRHGDRCIDVRVGEQVSAQGLFLDQPRQHSPYLVTLVEQVPNLQAQYLVTLHPASAKLREEVVLTERINNQMWMIIYNYLLVVKWFS